jgi:dUTPase
MTLGQNGVSIETYGPAYGGESAGLDLYYTGTMALHISPAVHMDRVLIPTGLHIALPTNRVALIQERSSITKTPLKLRAGVIDAGYTGEIFVNCINLGEHDLVIPAESKLPFQLIVVPVFNQYNPIVDETTWNEFVKDSARRNGALGSSD